MIPNPDRLTALQHLALQIATMLPKNDTEARKVLGLALQIVDGFLAPGDEADVVAPVLTARNGVRISSRIID